MITEKDLKRHRRWYAVAQRLCPLVLQKYSYRTVNGPVKLQEPSLILSNHLTESDMFMVSSGFRNHLYFVCGEHLIRSKIGPFLTKFFDPIPAPRGGRMLQAVGETRRRLKEGYNVAMFPEGSRSFHGETVPITTATAKLVKHAGCGLVTYRIHGGYFIAPRWAYHFRKGHAEGEIMHVYSSEAIKAMSAEELTAHINEDLHENAYEYQKKAKIRYRGKGLAEGLENYLIICPKCGSYDSLVAQGNDFHCSCCGLGGKYDEYGMLSGDGLPFDSVYDWGKWMEKRFDEDLAANQNDLLFTEKDITLYAVTDGHERHDLATGTLQIFRDRMKFEGEGTEKTIFFKDIAEKSLLYYGKTYLFTVPDGYYGMTGPAFHAWKLDRLTTQQAL